MFKGAGERERGGGTSRLMSRPFTSSRCAAYSLAASLSQADLQA